MKQVTNSLTSLPVTEETDEEEEEEEWEEGAQGMLKEIHNRTCTYYSTLSVYSMWKSI